MYKYKELLINRYMARVVKSCILKQLVSQQVRRLKLRAKLAANADTIVTVQ
jgi:hypothetical protein